MSLEMRSPTDRCGRAAVLVVLLGLYGCGGDLNNEAVLVDTTTRVSIDANRREGSDLSGAASVSRDGRYVAFSTKSVSFDPSDMDSTEDVYVKDLLTGNLTLVSRATGSAGAKGTHTTPALYFARNPAISADGRVVAFEARATNLGDPSGTSTQIYVRKLATDETLLVSRDSGASGAIGADSSGSPSISEDGRFVAFASFAHNLDDNDPNGAVDASSDQDIFVRDLQADFTYIVSRTSGLAGSKATNSPSASSGNPSISADGSFIAFDSTADNFGAPDDNLADVFVRNWRASSPVTEHVSVSSAGVAGNYSSDQPVLSRDGRFAAFRSSAGNLVSRDFNGLEDVFVRDRIGGTTTRVSVDSNGIESVRDSGTPGISDDGRWVVFESTAANLVGGDTNSTFDVFLHDSATRATTRVSVRTHGDPPTYPSGNAGSINGAISGDGRFVAFESDALNLVDDDTNGKRDVFIRMVRP